MKHLVIIPAYNEGQNIYNVVKNIINSTSEFDIVVINDGSKDNTYFEAKKAGAKVLNLSSNLGVGGAVQTGYLYAYDNNYDVAVQIDGDGQHCSEDLLKLLEEIKRNEVDMVIGSRFIGEGHYKPSLFRSIGIKYFSKLVSYLCKISYYDTTSGYRIVNRKAIEHFINYYPQDYPEVETIVYAVKNGLKVKEILVNMNKRQGGKSTITPLKSIYYMIKVTLALIIEKPSEGALQ
ncbi:glycosyltransferase family 2 protein [Clostridium pasteurianum]|uniref:Glycosyl transferase n=1 Tax=Clostridium pasteurianum BC1 TaxID=86416 RepID=R4K9E1_CLOPA|nr:glycosyltransferase family 2 protein [Clostridium pasteurianum]AGK97139.1 glycosyl transferase [Clostridium pasteurianum BC1]